MQKSDSLVNLAKALLQAKRGFTPIIRESENPGFKRNGVASKYADLSAVIEATEPSLLENGLLVIQFPHNEGSSVGVETLILHESGEFVCDGFALSLGKQDAQAGVGAITYARRAALKGVLSLKEEDDDGNAASRQPDPPRQEKPKASSPPRAEIPSGEPLSEEKSEPLREGSSDDLPTEKERKACYKLCTELQKELAAGIPGVKDSGLKASRGLPINRKVLKFLLHLTGVPEVEQITKEKWKAFFKTVDLIKNGEDGLKKLIDAVNEKSNTKEQAGGAS